MTAADQGREQAQARAAGPAGAATVKLYRMPTAGEATTYVVSRWRLVLLLAAAGTVLGVLGAWRFHPVYQSFTLIRLRTPSEARIGTGADSAPATGAADPADIIRRLKIALSSVATLEPIVTDLHDYFSPKELRNREALITWLGEINVDRKSGDLYTIMARGRSAVAAQKVTERLAEKALVIYRADAEQQAIRLETFARQQVQEASEKIKKLEGEMVDFLEKHPAMKVKSLDADSAAQDGDRLRNRRSPVGISLDRSAEKDPELKELLARQQRLRAELRSLSDSTTSATSTISEALREARNQLGVLRGQGLKDAHPQVKQLLARIKDLEAKLAQTRPGTKTANSEYESKVRGELRKVQQAISKRVQALAGASGASQKQEDLTELEAEWARMRRSHVLLTESHAKLEEVAVNAALKKNLSLYEASKLATIVSRPRAAETPTGLTRRTIIVAAAVVSLLGALGLAVLLGFLDTRLRRPEHLTAASESQALLAVLAEHPLRTAAAASRVKPHELSPGSSEEQRKPLPPPSGHGGSVIQWLRGTDDLDQAFSLLQPEGTGQGGGGAGASGGQTAWLDGVQTQLFDRNAPQPLGAALMISPAGKGALVKGAHASASSVQPPKICVLPSAPPYAPGLFVSVEPHSKPAEQMRLLAGRLESRVGTSLRVVAVSSWEEGVGKTTVAANLIMVLAEAQKRVLAVDACPGTASLTRTFGIEPESTGLCEQLQRWLDAKGGAPPWELVQIAETLTICTASAVARPALPLLASEAFTRFVADMSHFFDAIVIDTEALAVASDAVVLQRLVDGYVMVVAREQSTTRGLQNISSRLDPARILGFVFNEHRDTARGAGPGFAG